jgi:hypothetical protein
MGGVEKHDRMRFFWTFKKEMWLIGMANRSIEPECEFGKRGCGERPEKCVKSGIRRRRTAVHTRGCEIAIAGFQEENKLGRTILGIYRLEKWWM